MSANAKDGIVALVLPSTRIGNVEEEAQRLSTLDILNSSTMAVDILHPMRRRPIVLMVLIRVQLMRPHEAVMCVPIGTNQLALPDLAEYLLVHLRAVRPLPRSPQSSPEADMTWTLALTAKVRSLSSVISRCSPAHLSR